MIGLAEAVIALFLLISQPEPPLMRVTCYLPTGYNTASGQPTHLGGCAGRRQDIGKYAYVYDIDKNFVDKFEINDCGGNYKLRNGTAIDIFRENRTQANEWVATYGDYMYVIIIEKIKLEE